MASSISTWFRYMAHKLEYALTLSLKSHRREKLSDRELIHIVCKNLFYGNLHSDKGREMSPTMTAHENTLLIRKIPIANKRILEMGLPIEPYDWYVELRRHGTLKHCGFDVDNEGLLGFASGFEE